MELATASLRTPSIESVNPPTVPVERSIPTISPADSYKQAFARACKSIAPRLEQFEAQLAKELTSSSPNVAEVLQYVSHLGGKRLRPALTLLAAELFGSSTDESVRLAMVVELVHTATLIHDDILDVAEFRRHQPTVHVRWDVPTSILIGDWLFTHAYELANAGDSTVPGRLIANAAKRVCEGEIDQNHSIANWALSEPQYIDLLARKTGALCGVSCSMGAWSASAPLAAIDLMQSFGEKLGIAFQIFDDWLDIWGESEKSGKTLGTDFDHNKPTLPWIYLLSTIPSPDRQTLLNALENNPSSAKAELRNRLASSNASEYTLEQAKHYAAAAIADLKQATCNASLRPSQSEALYALEQIALASVDRRG